MKKVFLPKSDPSQLFAVNNIISAFIFFGCQRETETVHTKGEYLPTDFDPTVLDDQNFKEDAVREDIVRPLLVRLGYASSGDARMIRGKHLAHPFVMIGTSERPITLIPDYILAVGGKNAWVLDAKAPKKTITSGKHVEQVYISLGRFGRSSRNT